MQKFNGVQVLGLSLLLCFSTPSRMPVPEWASSRGWSDERLAAELLEHCGMALTPGSGFGDAGRGWLRLALVRPVEDLEIAVRRLHPWWEQHH